MVDLTIEEAVEALAKRASDLAVRPRTYHEKCAATADILTGVGSQLRENPALGGMLLGGGLGALGSGLSTAVGNAGKDERERKSLTQSMLSGGLAGGALGGGIGLARQMMGQGNQGLAHGDALGHGTFKDPATGETMRIDPRVLKNNPALAAKVRELSTNANPVQKTLQSAFGSAGNMASRLATVPTLGLSRLGNVLGSNLLGYDRRVDGADDIAPISSQVVPVLAGADLAANSHLLNTGERLGFGRVRPGMSLDPKDLMEGAKGKDSGVPRPIQDELVGNVGGAANRVGREVNTPAPGRSWLNRLMGNYGEGSRPVMSENTLGATRMDDQAHLTRDQATKVTEEGYHAREKLQGKDFKPRDLFRFRGKDYRIPHGTRTLGRALVYGGMPVLEYALQGSMNDSSRERTLRALMAEHAKKVKE